MFRPTYEELFSVENLTTVGFMAGDQEGYFKRACLTTILHNELPIWLFCRAFRCCSICNKRVEPGTRVYGREPHHLVLIRPPNNGMYELFKQTTVGASLNLPRLDGDRIEHLVACGTCSAMTTFTYMCFIHMLPLEDPSSTLKEMFIEVWNEHEKVIKQFEYSVRFNRNTRHAANEIYDGHYLLEKWHIPPYKKRQSLFQTAISGPSWAGTLLHPCTDNAYIRLPCPWDVRYMRILNTTIGSDACHVQLTGNPRFMPGCVAYLLKTVFPVETCEVCDKGAAHWQVHPTKRSRIT